MEFMTQYTIFVVVSIPMIINGQPLEAKIEGYYNNDRSAQEAAEKLKTWKAVAVAQLQVTPNDLVRLLNKALEK